MTLLTEAQLETFRPHLADGQRWTAALVAAAERFEINTTTRLAAFIAQVAHESRGFTHLVEDLNYRAERLMEVWKARFPTRASALPFEHQPEKLANHVYSNRNGNGDEASGDGWRYRGRGLMQLTGRTNYRLTGEALHLPLEQDPDVVAQPEIAALSAAQYWQSRGFNRLADVNTADSFDVISHRINGGMTGLAERRALWTRAKEALS
jgi:putative chitinase